LPLELRQPLGIVEPGRNIVRVEDDRCRDHRAGERSPPDLVGAGDRPVPGLAGHEFQAEVGNGWDLFEEAWRIGGRARQHGGRLARPPDFLQAPAKRDAASLTRRGEAGPGHVRRATGTVSAPKLKIVWGRAPNAVFSPKAATTGYRRRPAG